MDLMDLADSTDLTDSVDSSDSADLTESMHSDFNPHLSSLSYFSKVRRLTVFWIPFWACLFVSGNYNYQVVASISDAKKNFVNDYNWIILLPVITEIMEDKVIETIRYIKSISKKKPSINRIKTLKISDENVWSIENLPNLLQDICDKGLIELVDDSYKIKQTKKCELVEETIWPNSQIKIPLFLNQRL